MAARRQLARLQSAQSSITVHALSAGSLTLPDRNFIHPCDDPTSRRTVPSMSFLIQHTPLSPDSRTTRILFDLGIRDPVSEYSDPIRKHCENRQPISTTPNVVSSLGKGGLRPEDIDFVILSHVHWDHIGKPSDFSDARTSFVVGYGALDLLSGKSSVNRGSHCHFEANLLPLDRTIELPNPELTFLPSPPTSGGDPDFPENLTGRARNSRLPSWRPLSLFPHALDFFGDGSLYIINAPGHLPGHINILVRVRDEWVYLAGDSCHDLRLLTGEKEIAEWQDEQGQTCCIHADKKAADITLKRIRRLQMGEDKTLGGVEVVFAHDALWEGTAKDRRRFWPGCL